MSGSMDQPMQPNGYRYGPPPAWTNYNSPPAGVPPPPAERRGWLHRFFPDHGINAAFLCVHGLAALVGVVLTAVKWREYRWQDAGNINLLLASAILFTIFFVLEILAFAVGFMPKAKLIRLCALLSVLDFVLSIVAQVLGIVNTYKYHAHMRSQCSSDGLDGWSESGIKNANLGNTSDYQCDRRWDGLAAWDIVWLVVLVILCLISCYVTYRFQNLLTRIEAAATQPHAPFMAAAPQNARFDQTYPMERVSRTQSFDNMSAHDEAFGDHKLEYVQSDGDSFLSGPPQTVHSLAPRH